MEHEHMTNLTKTASGLAALAVVAAGAVFLGTNFAEAEGCAASIGQINAALDGGTVDDSLRANAAAMVQEAQQLLDTGQEAECMQMAERIKQSLGLNS
jgi:hypothetical protein